MTAFTLLARLLPASVLMALAAAAQAVTEPEPPVEQHPIGLAVFALLFIGFCVGMVWMIYRSNSKKTDDAPEA